MAGWRSGEVRRVAMLLALSLALTLLGLAAAVDAASALGGDGGPLVRL